MNKTLETAIAKISRLPDEEQEAIARLILEEIEAERGWDQRFAKSQDKLAALAERARQRVDQGEVSPFDPSDRPAI